MEPHEVSDAINRHAAEIQKHDEKIVALERFKGDFENMSWVVRTFGKPVVSICLSGVTLVSLIGFLIAAVRCDADRSNKITNQESAIANHEKEIGKLRDNTASQKEVDRLQREIERLEERLWRKSQAFLSDAEFVSIRGDKITLAIRDEDGKVNNRVFTVAPNAIIRLNDKNVTLAELKLKPNTPVRFMIGDDSNIATIVVETKK